MKSKKKYTEVKNLLKRLENLEPKDFAWALFQLESQSKLRQAQQITKNKPLEKDHMFFAKTLHQEIKEMYLQLAHHLRTRNQGSSKLMHRMFDFFSKTIAELVKLPHLSSSN